MLSVLMEAFVISIYNNLFLKQIFSNFSTKTYVTEELLTSCHKICFHEQIRKISIPFERIHLVDFSAI